MVVASRTESHARRLADQYDGRAVPLSEVQEAMAEVDLLVSCTGATGVVLPLAVVAAARADAERPLAVIDLALPHDVDPAVGELPGVSLFGLARLAEEVNEGEGAADVARSARSSPRRSPRSSPPAAPRTSPRPSSPSARWPPASSRARWQRLLTRLPDLDPAVRGEVEHAVRRVADKLLHTRPSGSSSSPTRPVRCPTPRRSPSCSRSIPTPSRYPHAIGTVRYVSGLMNELVEQLYR